MTTHTLALFIKVERLVLYRLMQSTYIAYDYKLKDNNPFLKYSF